MQRHTTLSTRSEPDLSDLNKGADLLLSRTKEQNLPYNWRKRMEQALIALSIMVGLLTLGLGLTIGYLFRAYVHDITPQYSHPEMYDKNGNPLPDELIAFSFDPDRLHDDDDD
tara:strand:- start:555 stop:893 length:339 start_codon:yes stop_codon:yes gene_type:complete